MVRFITGDSYAPENLLATAVLPRLGPLSRNPFDVHAREQDRASKLAYTSAISRVVEAIDGTPSPRARHTDILGFLVVAAERSRNATGRPVVVLASDMVNNVEKYRPYLGATAFSGCRVLVLACSSPTPALRNTWEAAFRGWGATSVEFVAIDEPVPAGILSAGSTP